MVIHEVLAFSQKEEGDIGQRMYTNNTLQQYPSIVIYPRSHGPSLRKKS